MLQAAREDQLSRFGTVSLDGTKLNANASRHSALSYGHAEKDKVRNEWTRVCLAWNLKRMAALRPKSNQWA